VTASSKHAAVSGQSSSVLAHIIEDIDSAMERDSSAGSRIMVLLCYPGLWAVWIHRVSHFLWCSRFFLPARLLSQGCRFLTGADIHPGAIVGRRLFINHPTGVVIGETAVLEHDVTINQGVTLGGTGKDRGKRHPMISHGVVIGNRVNVLGCITLGENSWIGAGSVVLTDVPSNSVVVGVPAHVVHGKSQPALTTDPHDMRDPLSSAILALSERVRLLEQQLNDQMQLSEPASVEDVKHNAYRVNLESLGHLIPIGERVAFYEVFRH